MRASVDELNVCIATARELVQGQIPPIGSSSLEEIKSLVAKYQVSFWLTITTPNILDRILKMISCLVPSSTGYFKMS